MTDILTIQPNLAPLAEFDMEKLNYLLAHVGTPLIMGSEYDDQYDVIVQTVMLGKMNSWDELNSIKISGKFRDRDHGSRDYRQLSFHDVDHYTFREA